MPNFKRHDNSSSGGIPVIATLTADAKNPILLLGSQLLEQGFDVDKWYVFLWDEKTMELGLQPPAKGEKGFVVKAQTNNREAHTVYMLRAKGFCQKFGIKDRMSAIFVTKVGNTWVLKMDKVK